METLLETVEIDTKKKDPVENNNIIIQKIIAGTLIV
jgi:hypothetical protein